VESALLTGNANIPLNTSIFFAVWKSVVMVAPALAAPHALWLLLLPAAAGECRNCRRINCQEAKFIENCKAMFGAMFWRMNQGNFGNSHCKRITAFRNTWWGFFAGPQVELMLKRLWPHAKENRFFLNSKLTQGKSLGKGWTLCKRKNVRKFENWKGQLEIGF